MYILKYKLWVILINGSKSLIKYLSIGKCGKNRTRYFVNKIKQFPFEIQKWLFNNDIYIIKINKL